MSFGGPRSTPCFEESTPFSIPGRRLDFSWAWADEPEREKHVGLRYSSDGKSGTLLDVTHGPYSQDARDAELRQQHLDGWKIHLPKLPDVR
jgi:uncharacterized protein YndB with AHSA1/START domain